MTYKQFHNLLRVMRSIDRYELPWEVDDRQWADFYTAPAAYFIRAPESVSRAIWDVMMKRVKPRETAE